MPDTKLVIRKENLPTRCEICHQADRFDPETEECLRCANVTEQLPAEQPSHQVPGHRNETRVWRRLYFGWLTVGVWCLLAGIAYLGSQEVGFLFGFFVLLLASVCFFLSAVFGLGWFLSSRSDTTNDE